MQPPPLDERLVRRLITAQFPQWAGLPVTRVQPGGWDNRTFRLGAELLVRLPSAAEYAEAVAKEQRWLPVLAPGLPQPVPLPLAQGAPGEGFPWPWSVYRWLDGEDAGTAPVHDLTALAEDLAGFLRALQAVDPAGGPAPGVHNGFRGAPLSHYDDKTRQALDTVDVRAATAVWETALSSTWPHPPRWLHGDVAVGNLLVRGGRLAGVVDFGTCGVGDPACDLVIAWTLFGGASRTTFHDGLGLDDDTWDRARGWALWKALVVRAGISGTTAVERRHTGRVLRELLG